MTLKNLFADDDAVSPVIGVILMVAITVILAAVIGTFVMGLGENVESSAQAGVTVDESENPHVVTITSMQNADTVKCSDDSGDSASTVGDTFECDDGANIIAETDDGTETVIRTNI